MKKVKVSITIILVCIYIISVSKQIWGAVPHSIKMSDLGEYERVNVDFLCQFDEIRNENEQLIVCGWAYIDGWEYSVYAKTDEGLQELVKEDRPDVNETLELNTPYEAGFKGQIDVIQGQSIQLIFVNAELRQYILIELPKIK